MSPPENPDSLPPSASCPRCGAITSHPFSGVGSVCLRCAGKRVFALGSEAPFPISPSDDTLEKAARADTATLDAPTRIGPYEIIEELGRGGMGRVYAARQSGLGRIVALKVLSVGPDAPPELEMRFLREAQTVARLRHPHIIAIHDSGRAAGHVYFSMDYIEGGDVARRLREHPFAVREAATLVAKVAAALAHAHAEGVLHRDIKPSNILLDGDEPHLADFGLAAQLETRGDFTSASGVFGTPQYLAPEAMRGGGAALSASSDLYALGVVLYALLTGRTPFAGASPAELPALVHDTEPPSLRLLAPAVPPDLETICLKCLERDPTRRYASAAALAEDLRRFLAGEPILARPVSGVGRFFRWCRRRPALAAIWFLVTALAIGSTVASLWILRARSAAEKSLALAQSAEASARERLRDAKLGEARAIRRTALPGRRSQALAALAEAAKIRPGLDLRNDALAALWLTDVRAIATWNLATGGPAAITFDPSGQTAAVEMIDVTGIERGPATIHHWGQPPSSATAPIAVPGTRVIGHLRYSANGQIAMARYLDATLRVFRVEDSKLLLTLSARPLPGGENLSRDFNDDYDFSPDGSQLVLGRPGGGITLHRVADGAEVARWADGPLVNVVRFSPDGTHVALARTEGHDSRHVFVLRAADLTLVQHLDQTASPNTFGWSSDGRCLVVSTEDNALAEFDARNGRLLARLSLGTQALRQVLFLDHDRFIATRSLVTKLSLISAATGQTELTLDGLSPSLLSAATGAASFVVSAYDGLATRWEIAAPLGLQIIPPPSPSAYFNAGSAGTMDVSPDGRWVATGHGRYTLIREIASGRVIAERDAGVGRPREATTIAFESGGGALLVCSTLDGLNRHPLVTAADGRLVIGPSQTLDPEPGFTMVANSADRRRYLLANFLTGAVKIVEPAASAAVIRARWITPGVYNAAFSPDSEKVVVNCSGMGPEADAQRLRVHRVADGAVIAELGAPSCDAAWSGDGRTVLTSNGQTDSILWDTATWQPRVRLKGELGGNATTFALSPDGSYAVILRDDRLNLVSTADGAPFATLEAPAASSLATMVKFLPNGRRFLVLWPDGRIDVVELELLHQALVPMGLSW